MKALWVGLLALPACGPAPLCEAAVHDEIRTLVTVEWSSREAGESWVEYGVGGALDRRTPSRSDGRTDHSAGLLGLRALEDVGYRAYTAGELICEGQIATGNLEPGTPQLDILVWDPERASPEPWVQGASVGDGAGAVVWDREGNATWYLAADPDRYWLDIQPVPGTSRIVHNVLDVAAVEDVGRIVELELQTGQPTGGWRAANAHHMFAQIPDGFAFIAVDARYWSDPEMSALVPVHGDAVVVLPREGEPETISSTWDWLEVEKNSRWDGNFYPTAFDWTHMNAIKWQPEADTYLVSLGNPGLVVEMSASTGLPVRTFGERGTLRPAPAEMRWDHPHDPSLTPEGNLLMFVNDAATGLSGAVELEIREDQRLYEVWRAGFDARTSALGQARRLANGNTMVSTGSHGRITEYTPEGDVVWQAETESGHWLGQIQLLTDLYEGE